MSKVSTSLRYLKAWTDKGYEVTSAKVSYILAWKPQDSNVEYDVCLANVILYKEQVKNNYSNYEDWNKRDIVFSKTIK